MTAVTLLVEKATGRVLAADCMTSVVLCARPTPAQSAISRHHKQANSTDAVSAASPTRCTSAPVVGRAASLCAWQGDGAHAARVRDAGLPACGEVYAIPHKRPVRNANHGHDLNLAVLDLQDGTHACSRPVSGEAMYIQLCGRPLTASCKDRLLDPGALAGSDWCAQLAR